MSHESQKNNNTALIVVAIIGVIGTIVASGIGAIGSYNTEKFRQEAELTRIALVSIATQGGATQIVLENTVNAPTVTPLPTYTFAPTYTAVPTNTLPPTATATVFSPPADGVLFQDNFDTNMNSDWTINSGTWIVSNGELSVLYQQGDNSEYKWIALNKPDWKNYILSLNVKIPYLRTTSLPVIAIRNNNVKEKFGLSISSEGHIFFALIKTTFSKNSPVAGQNDGFKMPSGSNLEIEVQGDVYTLRINGQQVQSITMPGYDSGGISLGMICGYSKGCPSFDNVKVMYLP